MNSSYVNVWTVFLCNKLGVKYPWIYDINTNTGGC